MLHLERLFLLATIAGSFAAADQCCFKDGDVISLRSDTGNYIGRCNNCVTGGAYKDSAFVHVKTPASSPWAQWTVVNTGNGKIALRADSGKYLSRCNNCAPGAAYPDEAFVHVDDWTTAPWAQWTCKEAGDGKVALQADTGKFLARCNNCVAGAYADTAMVHAKTYKSTSYAQWTIEANGKQSSDRCQAPTPTPARTVTPAPTTVTPAPTTVTSAPTPFPTTETPKPTTVTPAPTTVTPTPTTVTPAPTTVTPAPTTVTSVPTPAPTTETPKPTTVTPASTTMTPTPTTVTPAPTTVTSAPTPSPTTETPKPTTVTPAPTTVTPAPTTVTSVPTPAPTTVTPEPTTVTLAPTPSPTTVTPKPTTVTPAPTSATPSSCAQARVRKAWSALSAAEKTTYKNAIAKAMDSGLYQRFLSMHYDQMGNMQAHNTCVFIYWHRQFLVGFENMLRSLDAAYACVTIPYFDYINDNTKYMAKTCTTMDTCSPILNELGSASAGATKSVIINGYSISGRCDATFPLDHFNENEGTGKGGAKCVPRGNYASGYFPSQVGFTNIKNAIMQSKDVASVNTAIEDSAHNYMHSTLSGAMTNKFVSPSDPIFFSHHATIDALNAIYFKCRVATKAYSDAQKKTEALAFQGCTINGSPIKATSAIGMRVVINGQAVDVRLEASTKGFFKDVPSQYYQLIDNTNLGVNSYSYELSGLLGDLYTNCGAAGLQTASSLRSLKEDAAPKSSYSSTGSLQNYIVPNSGDHLTKYNGWRKAVTKVARGLGWPAAKTETEINKMVVAYYHYCLPGGITELSAEFKAQWNVKTVASKQTDVLNKLLDGSDPIQVPGWQALNKLLGCADAPAY